LGDDLEGRPPVLGVAVTEQCDRCSGGGGRHSERAKFGQPDLLNDRAWRIGSDLGFTRGGDNSRSETRVTATGATGTLNRAEASDRAVLVNVALNLPGNTACSRAEDVPGEVDRYAL
jgi:hypothetical protein